MKVFVDTSAWYTYFDRSDRCHRKATAFFKKKPGLVTSTLVLSETLALLQRRIGKKVARKAGGFLLSSPLVKLVDLEPELLREAFLVFEKAPAKISFVDSSNQVAMESLGLKTIFCFDRDFEKLGLKVVP